MSAGDHRLTPEHVLDAVRDFSPIKLDPCSNEHSTVDALSEIMPPEDGLTASWTEIVQKKDGMLVSAAPGVVWVNPPWSNPLPWAEKCAREYFRNGEESLLWLPCYPETKTASVIWDCALRVCFWGKRVHHPVPGEGKAGGSMWPTWMAYFGNNVPRFDWVFRRYGRVVPSGIHLRRVVG